MFLYVYTCAFFLNACSPEILEPVCDALQVPFFLVTQWLPNPGEQT